MPFTIVSDYHEVVRNAIAATLNSAKLGLPVVALDDPETDLKSIDLPAIVVACVGPESNIPAWDTNATDGLGYSCAVMLMAPGITSGTKNVPDLTAFRRQVRVSFANQRLAGVSQVGYCEVSDSGPLYDKDSPAFQKLQTAMIVTGVGRWPRA